MSTSTNKTSVDTYVNQLTPTKNYDTYTVMVVGALAGAVRYSYCLIGLPFSRGSKVNVHQGKFRIWNTSTWSGTFTVRVRAITSTWNRNGMTWNGTGWRAKPTVGATVVDVTKTNPVAKTMWEFDVHALLQSVANGSPWYGFRIEILSGDIKAFHGSANVVALRPELFVDYSSAPDKPAHLAPGAARVISSQYPIFQSDFVDGSGSTQQAGMQIQLDTAGTDVGGVDYDSGMLAVTSPEIHTDPADPERPAGMPAWGGVTDGASTYWRCKVQDAAGVASDWSDWTPFTRKHKGSMTIASPGSTVSDASFTVIWTFPDVDRFQAKFQVIITDLNGKVMHDSHMVTSTDVFYQLPSTIALKNTDSYKCEVRIWDTENRMNMPKDPAYASLTQQFSYLADNTVTPFNNLTGVGNYQGTPWVVMYFDRATVPDKISVYRDDVLIWSDTAAELFLGGPGTYGFLDHMATAHESHTWKIVAVVNGKGSVPVSVTYTPYIAAPWIGDFFTGGVYLFNPEYELYENIAQEIVEFVGNYTASVVTTGDHGKTGTITGKVTPESYPGLTMPQIKSILDYVVGNAGATREIHIVNQAFQGYLYNVRVTPGKDITGLYYTVSLNFGENI